MTNTITSTGSNVVSVSLSLCSHTHHSTRCSTPGILAGASRGDRISIFCPDRANLCQREQATARDSARFAFACSLPVSSSITNHHHHHCHPTQPGKIRRIRRRRKQETQPTEVVSARPLRDPSSKTRRARPWPRSRRAGHPGEALLMMPSLRVALVYVY